MSLCFVLLAAVFAPQQLPAPARQGYADLLQKQVKNGRVAYQVIETEELPKLDAYLSALATSKIPEAKDARLGMFIDAYNALVIRSVIRAGRPRSVLDHKGFFDRETHTVAGASYTLNDFEKKMINPIDPRTHFALVCAAVGCPILDTAPYFGSDVEARLSAATRRYLAGPTGARVAKGQLELSKIFDWYQADFGGAQGVLDFARVYLPEAKKVELGPGPKVSHFDYNWTLNQQ